MSVSAIRNSWKLTRVVSANRTLFSNCIPRSLFAVGQKNTRTITRSLFFLSRNRNPNPLGVTGISNKCSCCGLHTKGDEELAAFLTGEIDNEKKAHVAFDVSQLGGFQVCSTTKGAEVMLQKQLNDEMITIKANVNNSVDAEETVDDPNETKEQETEMRAKPEFTIEITKAKKILSFHCTYNHSMPDEEPETEPYNDSFQISEVSLHEGEFEDSTYVVSGDIMDGYLYDLLMNYLEERGISNDFADKMIVFFTSYEHQLYINLLKGMKSFIEK
ncbi:hypothetical protein JTE90_024975 [Oedothorax gibbosus]|uniref:Complement component 1 Q subcomponent-binding protein, mitochondrial n=1 Tax=Oedothorax gibbosus TaxID=931172 RepID=A0AAV6VWJ6_9ARAC|nr:hypothetical protein JTE90_024975 [Oedothorax gibbosus]